MTQANQLEEPPTVALRSALWTRARAILGADCGPEELEVALGAACDPAALAVAAEYWIPEESRSSLDGAFEAQVRRRHGIYFTPPDLAAEMASELGDPRSVIDLSSGGGGLLAAAARRWPAATCVGVERDPMLCVASALAVLRTRGRFVEGDRFEWGDGLQARGGERYDAVLGNPPYVPEKHNADLFGEVREANPDLNRYFRPRMDLHYLFLHRALDALREGGMLVYLTSAYWLTATGAAALRRDLNERSTLLGLRKLGDRVFEDAPGHHSLVLVARRGQVAARCRVEDAAAVRAWTPPRSGPWHPFARGGRRSGTPLKELAIDRQGIVSGADRVTRRMVEILEAGAAVGAPIFLWEPHEVPAGDERLFRPLVRRGDCEPNRVITAPLKGTRVLWSDGRLPAEDDRRVEELLAAFRPVLERRREARNGSMPWQRLWWPRDEALLSGPKLVVPRRAKRARFCLDLGGNFVSSDCTFIVAPQGVEPVEWLATLMFLLNSPESERELREFGKRKGDVMEFYSEPLRALRIPARRVVDRLVSDDDDVTRRVKALMETVGVGPDARKPSV